MLSEIEQFIDWVRMRSPQARTWRDYRCDLELLNRLVEDRDPSKLFPQDVDSFVSYQIEHGYKPSTVNRRLAAVVSFYRYLISQGQADACPVLPRRHYLREPQRLPRPVNEQDLRKFFSAVHDIRDRAMFTLTLAPGAIAGVLRCGLRIGEVSELQMTDLYLGEKPSRLILRGKGSRERTIYLSQVAVQALQSWLAQRTAVGDKHVFLSYQHRKLSTTSINIRINHVRRISGVDLTAHRLRHTFGRSFGRLVNASKDAIC